MHSSPDNTQDKIKRIWYWIQEFHWDKFFLCIFMYMVLPLAPLIIELLLKSGSVSLSSLLISTSMYCLSLGSSSKKTSIFALSLVVALILTALYGGAMRINEEYNLTKIDTFYIYCVLGLFFIIHLIERFKRHAIDCEAFWNFN
ncbi:Uncharacterised protein [Neisseria subflava]|uniref:Uncharacterized protein n=1 Tax=Neisseria subflava TaxID=28449 RepID=A0A9X9SMB8_NEISU|nr:hypothetical protein [Neisseria subflava]VTY03704.1 Uncharacterised protein [Neisseria subflava]